jgi:O-antigen/teichoic acid export membrane protein
MAAVRQAPAERAEAGADHLGKVARGGFFNLAGSVVAAVVTLLFTVVITRTLDKASAGVFFAVTSAFTLVFSVARLGVPTGLVYFVSRYRALGRTQLLRPVVRAGAVPVAVLAVALGVAGVALATPIADLLVQRTDSSTVLLVRVLSVFLVVAALNDVYVGTTRGYGVMRPLVLVDRVARPIGQLVLIAVLAVAGSRSATAMGTAWVVPFLPSLIVLVWWSRSLRRRTLKRSAVLEDAEHEVREVSTRSQLAVFWRFTLPRTIGSIAQMVLQRADVILIGALRGPAEAAVYAAATRFLVFGQLGGGAISTTIQPKISALLAKDDVAGARLVYRTSTIWLMLLTWPIYLLFCVFSTDLLRLFGGGYSVGAPVIIVLSLAMLVATACGAVDVVLVMAGRSSWTMANSLVALAVNLGLNVLLIPRHGIVGAAIAWAVAILINNLAPLTELAVWRRLHPFGRPTALAGGLATFAFAVLPLLVRLLAGHSLVWELVAAAAGGGLYLAGLWRLREPLELRSLLAVRRGRR